MRVWQRARDYLGLMNEPAICLSVLGPSRPSSGHMQSPGIVNWSEGGSKMIAHIPFYILGEQEGMILFFLYKFVNWDLNLSNICMIFAASEL